jgi:putative DNA primase/helicase
LETIHGVAAVALKGADRPGMLQLVRVHPAGGAAVTRRYPIGDVETMTAHAVMDAEAGFNIYVEGRTVSETASGRGDASATRGVFAFVIDSDGDKGKGGQTDAQSSLVVETSPGNAHRWLFLNRALTAEQATPIGAAIRSAVGADSDTGVITQPYRVAGTPNYPGKAKQARGRVPTPTRLLERFDKLWSADELRETFPAVEKPRAALSIERPTGSSGCESAAAAQIFAEQVGNGRGTRFFAAASAAFRDGLTLDDAEDLARSHPDGVSSKFLEPYDRLRRELERAWSKFEAQAAEAREAAGKPTYADAAQPVDLARQAVEEGVQRFIAEANAYRLAADEEAEPPVHAVAVSTGVGKTRITARTLADYIIKRRAEGKTARPVLYAVPRHRLGDEIANQFDGYGITARVFRGRQADDPERPGRKMCDDLEAVEIALNLGEPIQSACCKKKLSDGTEYRCPYYDTCSYQAQKNNKPEVWIVAHQMLFQGQKALGKVEMVIVDESFWQAGIRTQKQGLTLDEIAAFLPFGTARRDSKLNDVESYRGQLARALRRQDSPGGVLRANLVAEHLTPETCSQAIKAEWKLKEAVPIWPGMPRDERRLAARAATKAKHARAFIALWAAARDVLNDETVETSGRLYLDTRDSDEGKVLVAKARSVKAIVAQWRKPTLLLDATLPPAEILNAFYPTVLPAPPIEAAMPHVHVRQVLAAPVSATKLKLDDEGAPRRNLLAVRRTILRRFMDNGRSPLLVIAQKAVAGWLKDSGLPAGIGVEHFNNVAGLDQYRDVRGLMVIGRAMPQPAAVEALAGALTGRQPALNEGRYPYTARGIRTRDGSPSGVECASHPDPAAEACRWQICEGELMQAIGRARGVNRTADTPLTIDLVANVVLPLTVSEVENWSPPGEETEMLIEGVTLDSPSDMSTVWPTIWETPMAAKKWTYRAADASSHKGPEPYKEGIYIGIRPRVERFRYQQPGARQKWRTGGFDPAVVADPRAWLEARLGPLAKFEIVASEPASEPAPPLIGRSVDIEPDSAARFGCAVALPAASRPAAPKAEVVRWHLPSDAKPTPWPSSVRAIRGAAAPIRLEAAE